MPSPPSSDYRRVAVIAPGQRVDLALPGHLAIADLLPDVLGLARIGTADDDGTGWRLGRIGGPGFAADHTLDEVGVRDGDVLLLRPGRLPDPLPVVDEITDVTAAVAAEKGTVTPGFAPRIALAVSGSVVAAAVPAVWQYRDIAAPATLVAAAVMAVGAVGGRRPGAIPRSPVFGVAALTFGAIAAAGLWALPSAVEPLLVALLMLVGTPLSAAVLGVGRTAAAAVTTAAGFGVVAAAAHLMGAAAGPIAAGVLVVATTTLPWAPRWAAAVARLPHPGSSPLDGPLPAVDLDHLQAAARRAADHLTGIDLAAAVTTGISALMLLRQGDGWATALAALGVANLLIRAGGVQITAQVAALTVPAALTAVAGMIMAASRLPATAAPWIPTGAAVIAGTVVAVGVAGNHAWSPAARRATRALGSVVVLAVVPVAVAVLHGYEAVRHR